MEKWTKGKGSSKIPRIVWNNKFKSYEISNYCENPIPHLDNLTQDELIPICMEQLFRENDLKADRIITAIAPSKTFNIPGLGLSSLIIPNLAERNALQKVFNSLHLSASNPFSIAAFEAAYRFGGEWKDGLMAYLKVTHDMAIHYIQEHCHGITRLEFLDYRELFRESDIKSAVAFFSISFSISIRCSFFFSSRISICSGVMGAAFVGLPWRSSFNCRTHRVMVDTPTFIALAASVGV